MNKKQRIALLLVLITSLVISGCGPGQLFGPTITPTPTQTLSPTSTQTPTQTMTPTPTQTMTPTQAATLTPAVTVDPDCGSIPGNNLSLSQAIIGSWKNGDVIVWVFCRSGKLIEKNIADKTEEVKIYTLNGTILIIDNKQFGKGITIEGDKLTITLAPGFLMEFERIK